MKRFLVVQLIEMIDRDSPLYREIGEENVYDADTQAEAERWIESQNNPDSYVVRDQAPTETEEETLWPYPMSFDYAPYYVAGFDSEDEQYGVSDDEDYL